MCEGMGISPKKINRSTLRVCGHSNYATHKLLISVKGRNQGKDSWVGKVNKGVWWLSGLFLLLWVLSTLVHAHFMPLSDFRRIFSDILRFNHVKTQFLKPIRYVVRSSAAQRMSH